MPAPFVLDLSNPGVGLRLQVRPTSIEGESRPSLVMRALSSAPNPLGVLCSAAGAAGLPIVDAVLGDASVGRALTWPSLARPTDSMGGLPFGSGIEGLLPGPQAPRPEGPALASDRSLSARPPNVPGVLQLGAENTASSGIRPLLSGGPSPLVPPPSLARPGFAALRAARVAQIPRYQPPPPKAGFYQRGLLKAQAVMDQALANATRERQDSAAKEFAAWLSSTGEDIGLATVGPESLLVYTEEWWLPNHPERKQEDAGPQAVKGMLSALSGYFTRTGRVGPYDPATGRGNPCESPWVTDYRAGYTRLRMLGGYDELSAVPLSEEKYERLCEYLMGQLLAAQKAVDALLFARDLLCAQFMWQSTYRGFDTGKLAWADFCNPEKPDEADPRLPLPPPWEWAPGDSYRMCVRERGTKTYRAQRAPAVFLEPNLARPAVCFPQTFAYYVWRASQPDAEGCAISCYLFRPLRSDRRSFKEEPLSSSALGARIRRHLHDAELYEGETNHSFRRGALQAAAKRGLEQSELKSLGQIKSTAVLGRYTDEHRHLGAQQPLQRRRVA